MTSLALVLATAVQTTVSTDFTVSIHALMQHVKQQADSKYILKTKNGFDDSQMMMMMSSVQLFPTCVVWVIPDKVELPGFHTHCLYHIQGGEAKMKGYCFRGIVRTLGKK